MVIILFSYNWKVYRGEGRTFDYGWHKKFTLIVHSTRQNWCEWFWLRRA